MSGEAQDAGALATRLVAWLVLTAAALFGVVAFGISRLEQAGGDAAYLLPGSRATLDTRVVVLLAVLAGVAALVGVALLALSPSPSITASLRPRASRRRSFVILVAGLLALAAVLLVKRGGL